MTVGILGEGRSINEKQAGEVLAKDDGHGEKRKEYDDEDDENDEDDDGKQEGPAGKLSKLES